MRRIGAILLMPLIAIVALAVLWVVPANIKPNKGEPTTTQMVQPAPSPAPAPAPPVVVPPPAPPAPPVVQPAPQPPPPAIPSAEPGMEQAFPALLKSFGEMVSSALQSVLTWVQTNPGTAVAILLVLVLLVSWQRYGSRTWITTPVWLLGRLTLAVFVIAFVAAATILLVTQVPIVLETATSWVSEDGVTPPDLVLFKEWADEYKTLLLLGAAILVASAVVWTTPRGAWLPNPGFLGTFTLALGAMAVLGFLVLKLDPAFANAFVATVTREGLVVAAIAAAILIAKAGWVAGGVVAAAAVLLVTLVYKPACALDDMACKKAVAEQVELERQARETKAVQETALATIQKAVQSAVTPQEVGLCNGVRTPVTFGPTWVQVNKHAQCSGDLYYDEQVVTLWAKTLGDDTPKGPFKRGDVLPDDTEWVMSEGKTFPGSVILVPDRRRTTARAGSLR